MADRERGEKSAEMQNPAEYRTGAKPLKVLL